MVNMISALIAQPQLTNFIGQMINKLFEFIGNYGWTVVLFTVILKVALSPFDVWQKMSTRKNAKTMELLKPELEKLQKQYGNNKQLYSEKQMALFKKHKYSMFSSCLPTIITMVVFFVVFAGFNATIKYQNEMLFYNLYNAYYQGYNGLTGEAAVQAFYTANNFGFLWIHNIFMPDTWSKIIPTFESFSGTGIGKLGITMAGVDSAEYNKIMGPIINEVGGRWNGYLILPVLTLIFNFISQKFMMSQTQAAQPPVVGGAEMQQATQMNMKIMQWMMPVMMVVFSLFYSSAFTLYMFVSSLITTIFQLITNIVFKQIDKKNDAKLKKETFR